MRVISLVVEGFERARDDGVLDWLFVQDADIICLQDTRCSEYSLRDDAFFPTEYNAYFLDNYEDHRRHGVTIYCKKLPKAIMMGLGFSQFDSQGLYLQADYGEVSVGSILVPPSWGAQGDASEKMAFLGQLSQHLKKVRNKRRGYILCGGWEIAHRPVDAEEAGNRTDIPGFGKEERDWLNQLFAEGYGDAFRAGNSDDDEYSWWPEGDDNPGVRTDTQIVSEDLLDAVQCASIYTVDAFSSHAPIIIDYDISI